MKNFGFIVALIGWIGGILGVKKLFDKKSKRTITSRGARTGTQRERAKRSVGR